MEGFRVSLGCVKRSNESDFFLFKSLLFYLELNCGGAYHSSCLLNCADLDNKVLRIFSFGAYLLGKVFLPHKNGASIEALGILMVINITTVFCGERTLL